MIQRHLLFYFGQLCQFQHIFVSTTVKDPDGPAYAWLWPTFDYCKLHLWDICNSFLRIEWAGHRVLSWVVWPDHLLIFLQTMIWRSKCYFRNLLARCGLLGCKNLLASSSTSSSIWITVVIVTNSVSVCLLRHNNINFMLYKSM